MQSVPAILAFLKQRYPVAECALLHTGSFQLLVATILSAQCTDVRVNIVTPQLFAAFPTPQAMAEAPVSQIEEHIRTVGLFRAKAKSLSGMAKMLMEKHNGIVPATLEELTALPGVGRKTANVVLGNIFSIPAMVVDTHVKRIANRLLLTGSGDPEVIEKDLMQRIPREEWTDFSHRIILFGRDLCSARNPKCSRCGLLNDVCPGYT